MDVFFGCFNVGNSLFLNLFKVIVYFVLCTMVNHHQTTTSENIFYFFPSILSKSKLLDAQLYWEFLRGLGVLGNCCTCWKNPVVLLRRSSPSCSLGFGHFASKNDGRYRVKVRVFSQST